MINQKNKNILEKQQYRLAGKHSAVKICEWSKHSLRNEGECYKQKFYGIKSHGCCEMSPSAVWCDNKCLHCWRAIENTQGNKIPGNLDEPKKIIETCILERKKLLTGFKGNKNVNLKKWQEAQIPSHFAISLIGEPTLYPKLGELIQELRKNKKTSFLVTNGLHPEAIKLLEKNKQLPTQLYISMNASNETIFKTWHNSTRKNAWKNYNETLKLLKRLDKKTRTVIRMTLVREKNMQDTFVKQYAALIKKANPLFIEVKGFMSVGFSRKRLGYETMPTMQEITSYAKKLAKELNYKILAKHDFSRIVLLGKKNSKTRMKIKPQEI